MAEATRVELGEGLAAEVRFTAVEDGDFRIVHGGRGSPCSDPSLIEGGVERRRAITDAPWTWIRQVHQSTILAVGHPGEHAGATADGLLTLASGCPIAVTTADCAPVILLAERGAAVLHAGWRGLMAGIIEEAAARLHALAGEPVQTLLGPCIGPEAYEFGAVELQEVVARYGPSVASKTADGRPALDVPAAVGAACSRSGWPVPDRPPCTSALRWYSHRTRGDVGRQTAVVWLEEVA